MHVIIGTKNVVFTFLKRDKLNKTVATCYSLRWSSPEKVPRAHRSLSLSRMQQVEISTEFAIIQRKSEPFQVAQSAVCS